MYHYLHHLILRAATGFEFGDNEASEPKTDDNGVAQISFQVNIRLLFFHDFLKFITFIIVQGFKAADCVSLGLSEMGEMA